MDAKFQQKDLSDCLLEESGRIDSQDQKELAVLVRVDADGIYRVSVYNGTTEDGIAALNIGNHVLLNSLMPEGNLN